MIGNIEIDSAGNFIRTYDLMGKRIKEGFYSPITQNERHMMVMGIIGREAKSNFITKKMYEKYFWSNHKSLVVLANPKTFLNAKYAKKEVKNQVIRADQLNAKLREIDMQSSDMDFSNSQMLELANFYLSKNIRERSDYSLKYKQMVHEVEQAKNKAEEVPVIQQQNQSNASKKCPKCGKELVLRTSTKGEFKGNRFWGCSGYPKCRFIDNNIN